MIVRFADILQDLAADDAPGPQRLRQLRAVARQLSFALDRQPGSAVSICAVCGRLPDRCAAYCAVIPTPPWPSMASLVSMPFNVTTHPRFRARTSNRRWSPGAQRPRMVRRRILLSKEDEEGTMPHRVDRADCMAVGRVMAEAHLRPVPSACGLRPHGLAMACANYGTTPGAAVQSFINLALLADAPSDAGGSLLTDQPAGNGQELRAVFDDQRLKSLDAIWQQNVLAWTGWTIIHLPDPADTEGRLRHRLWAMLAGLRQIAYANDILATGDDQFIDAINRLCPGLPRNALHPGQQSLDVARQAVAKLLEGGHPPPLPTPGNHLPALVTTGVSFIEFLERKCAGGVPWRRDGFKAAATRRFGLGPGADASEVAACTLALLGSVEPRKRGADLVDELWASQVESWFAGAPHGLGKMLAARRHVLMLLALDELAASGAKRAAPSQDFLDARLRLCPKQPAKLTTPDRPAVLGLTQLLRGQYPIPMPCSVDPATGDLLDELAKKFMRPVSWLGAARVESLARWVEASRKGDSVAAAQTTLACIGGKRQLNWHWLGGAFVDAAQAWVIQQAAQKGSAVHNMCRLHLTDRSHVELVIQAQAWLAGIDRPAKEVPEVAPGMRAAAGLAALPDKAASKTRAIVEQRFKKGRKSLLVAQLFQPASQRVFTDTDTQIEHFRQLCRAPKGPPRLRARLFLRVVHSRLGLAPPTARNAEHLGGLYGPLRDGLLRDAASAPQDCSLRLFAEGLADSLGELWLFGGSTRILPLALDETEGNYPSCFRPHDMAELQPLELLVRRYGSRLTGLEHTYRLALLALDVMTDGLHAADGRHFKHGQYVYLEGALRTSRTRGGAIAKGSDLDGVRKSNHSLFKELAQSNLQHRVRHYMRLLDVGQRPVRCCPLCRCP
jgi:hypothetical protein